MAGMLSSVFRRVQAVCGCVSDNQAEEAGHVARNADRGSPTSPTSPTAGQQAESASVREPAQVQSMSAGSASRRSLYKQLPLAPSRHSVTGVSGVSGVSGVAGVSGVSGVADPAGPSRVLKPSSPEGSAHSLQQLTLAHRRSALFGQKNPVEVMREKFMADPDGFVSSFQSANYPITSDEKMAFAKLGLQASSQWEPLRQNFKMFGFTREEQLNLLTDAIRNPPSRRLPRLSGIQGLNEIQHEDSIVLLRELAKKGAHDVLANLESLPVNEPSARVEILADMIHDEHDVTELSRNMSQLGLSDEDKRNVLAHYLKHTCFPALRGATWNERSAKALGRLRDVADNARLLGAELLRNMGQGAEFEANAERYGITVPELAMLLDKARNEKDALERRRLTLLGWRAVIQFTDPNIEEVFRSTSPQTANTQLRQLFSSTLKGITDFPEQKHCESLLRCLAFCMQDGNMRQKFVATSEKLGSRRHTVLMVPMLAHLAALPNANPEVMEKLERMLYMRPFRDQLKCKPIFDCFLSLLQPPLDADLANRVLGVLTAGVPQEGPLTSSHCKDFISAVQSLTALLDLRATSYSEIASLANNHLNRLDQNSRIESVLAEVLHEILGRSNSNESTGESMDDFASRMQSYLSSTRDRNALISHIVRLYVGLAFSAEKKQKLFHLLNRYIDSAILNTDPAAFSRARNDLSVSEHLTRASEINPAALRKWFDMSLEEPANLDSRAPKGKRNLDQWKLQFKQDPEDYFLCGTEVPASCLNVYGQATHAPSLMGIVMQGRSRLLALKSPDDRLQARILVRLGIDPAANNLVMHMARPYAQVGVPEDYLERLGQFGRKIANEIGVPLVSHIEEISGDEEYPNSLEFYPDAAVSEEVDVNGLGNEDCSKGFVLEGARYVKLTNEAA